MDTEQLNKKKPMQTECPFAAPNEEAIGEWFIGRQNVIKKMAKEIVSGNRICNYHIIGLPRIGKSSLLKAFQKYVLDNQLCQHLIISYISLDNYDTAENMWKEIGKILLRDIKKVLGTTDKYESFNEELEYEDVDPSNIDYGCVCSIARSMRNTGISGLIMIDEFDNFSSFATRGTVGQFRTLFSASEYGTRAILASRRMVERIEEEVSGAINSNVSTLAPIFISGYKLTAFNEDDINEYWQSVAKRINKEVSEDYKNNVKYYVGNHPYLLNLLNKSYWTEQKSPDYLYMDNMQDMELSKNTIESLHEAFNFAVWRNLEKWGLLRPLILTTWGPNIEITNAELSELCKYGVINPEQNLIKVDGPIRIAISQYFTEWMRLKRYCLPFGDEWSMAEKNMRAIVKRYCEEMYQGDEEKMVTHLQKRHADHEKRMDKQYTTEGRFKAMKDNKEKNIRKYPDMSASIIDYSMPSDLPAIFFKWEWTWFNQIFNGSWEKWENKFRTITEIRNLHSHNNKGVPEYKVKDATEYCHEINEHIESFLANDKQ